MDFREAQPSQDFQKMCKHAEREQESKKVAALIERVKRQLAERQSGISDASRKAAVSVVIPSRSALFER